MDIQFEWDPTKAQVNHKKHHVSFIEASSIFFDENGTLIHDPDHSEKEDRFLLIGMSAQLRILVVSHTYRRHDHAIRIISARKANSFERDQYAPGKRK